jgi:hypothetical protein
MTMHFDHVLITMVLQFIEGFAGVTIRCPGVSQFGLSTGQLVTIHADGDSMLEILGQVA